MVEAKPNLVIPPLVLYLKKALAFLHPLIKDHDPQHHFFEACTSPKTDVSTADMKKLQSGTFVVKSLVAVQTLMNLLADMLHSQLAPDELW